MSWLRRSEGELEQSIAYMEDHPPHYRARGTMSAGKMPGFKEERGGHEYEDTTWGHFQEDIEDAMGDIDAENEVVEEYVNRLSRGRSATTRKQAYNKMRSYIRRKKREEGW